MFRRLVLLVTAFLLIGGGAWAQGTSGARPGRPRPAAPPPAAPAAPRAMTNADVIKLATAGLPESIILESIRSAAARAFDVSPDGLVALKVAHVPDGIIAAILRAASGQAIVPDAPPPPPQPPVAQASLSLDPLTEREAGIYVDQGDGQLVLLEPTVFTQGRTGGVFTSMLTYGIKKAKWKAVIRGTRASARINGHPTFYFYFERKHAGLSGSGAFGAMFAAASSPNQFVLARFTVKESDRELIVGQFGAFGANSGARSEDTVAMRIERLAPGIYRVSTDPLEPGEEYCFFYAGGSAAGPVAGTTQTLFDFGYDGSPAKTN